MSVSALTLSPLCENDITGKTISVYMQMTFGTGSYATGGLSVGITAYADAQTIDVTNFLQALIQGEATETTTYDFKYNPTTDKVMIFSAGTELANGSNIPAAITGDTIIGKFTFNRL